jgi:TPR repeat protein
MSEKRSWVWGLYDRLVAWRDKHAGPPSVADANRRDEMWDYQQADLQVWNAEPDWDALAEAMGLIRIDPERALGPLHGLAERGSPCAMNAIGECYLWGRGMPVDHVEGVAWVKQAHERGLLRATLNYGKTLLWRGDLDGAEAVFRPAAENDWAPALYWLGRIELRRWRPRSFSRARPLLERAMAKGSPAARAGLGMLMALGAYGIRNMRLGRDLLNADWQAAVEQTRAAARQNASGDTLH